MQSISTILWEKRSFHKQLGISHYLPTFPYMITPDGKFVLRPWRIILACTTPLVPTVLLLVVILSSTVSAHFSTLWFLADALMDISILLTITSCLLMRNKLKKALICVRQLDGLLAMYGLMPRRFRKKGSWIFGIQLAVLVISVAGDLYVAIDVYMVFSIFSFQHSLIIFYSVTEMFVTWVNFIKAFLDHIIKSVTPHERRLEEVCHVHDCLSDVASHLKEYFQWPIMFIILSCFLAINVNVYLMLGPSKKFNIMTGVWLILLLCPIIRLCVSVTELQNKEYDFYWILLMTTKKRRWHETSLLDNDKLCAHLGKQKSIHFNICGQFELNTRFLASLLGSIATYSVILLQMGEKQE